MRVRESSRQRKGLCIRKGKRGHKLGKKEKSAYVEEEVMRVQSPKKRIVQREKVTQTWKKEKSAYVEEEEEVERKTTGNIRRRESIELSLLASRLDTNFYFHWSFLRLNCSCSAALGLD